MTILRLSLARIAGVMRPIAEFPAERAPGIAYHAKSICDLVEGTSQYKIVTTVGRAVDVVPHLPVAPPNELERALAVALEAGQRLSDIKRVAFTQYGVTEEQWAAVNWANIQSP